MTLNENLKKINPSGTIIFVSPKEFEDLKEKKLINWLKRTISPPLKSDEEPDTFLIEDDLLWRGIIYKIKKIPNGWRVSHVGGFLT